MILFFKENPALLLALTFLVGSGSFLNGCWLIALLWALFLCFYRFWPALLLLIAALFYSYALYPKSTLQQSAYFSIHTVKSHQTPFSKGYIYKGIASTNGQQVPCTVFVKSENRPTANRDYLLYGEFHQRGPFDYSFKAKKWTAVSNTWSLAEFRFQMKTKFSQLLQTKLHTTKVASFLSSLITGDVEDRTLRYEFGKLGLQHILAISGFHFAILIAFLEVFLSLFLPFKTRIITLIFLVNLYFLFVGSLPAVQRSWLTALLYLVAKLLGKNTTALNLLGIAMLIECLLDPFCVANLGFQLSFLSCAGILLFASPIDTALQALFPKRNQSEVSVLSSLSQHVYFLASFFRKAIGITLAVNLAIAPLLLYHFHQFPLLSLLYNLFFPFLITISLFLLLTALALYPLFEPTLIFKLTNCLTKEWLELAAYPPTALSYTIHTPEFPALVVVAYLSLIFSLAIRHKTRIQNSYTA